MLGSSSQDSGHHPNIYLKATIPLRQVTKKRSASADLPRRDVAVDKRRAVGPSTPSVKPEPVDHPTFLDVANDPLTMADGRASNRNHSITMA
jgi:hypothetical protein